MAKAPFKKYKDFDWPIVISALIIFGVGLLFLFSSLYPNKTDCLFKQLVWFLVGVLTFVLITNINYRNIVGFAGVFYVLTIGLLIAVLIFGGRRFGAQRWIVIGPVSIQPSEFAKFFVMLTLVHYMTYCKSPRTLPHILMPILIVLVPFVLIMMEPDLGTALILIPILFVLMYAWGVKLGYLIFIGCAGFLLAPFGWFLLRDYQKERLLVFLDPGKDPLGAGYTIIQSKIAIGSGRLFGKGWLAGTQNQLNFLPERHTDFIFSVIGEEFGFLGGLILIGLYYLIIRRAFFIAEKTEDPCGKLLCVGIASMIATQVIINMCMTMGFMPVVGLPLPLVSYGGSSLLVTIASLAVLEGVAIYR